MMLCSGDYICVSIERGPWCSGYSEDRGFEPPSGIQVSKKHFSLFTREDLILWGAFLTEK